MRKPNLIEGSFLFRQKMKFIHLHNKDGKCYAILEHKSRRGYRLKTVIVIGYVRQENKN